MQYWIDRYGFWGYMQRFPLNPITIVAGVAAIGIVVLLVNAAARKKQADKFRDSYPGAALLTLNKKNIADVAFADNIRIVSLNGAAARWFFAQPGVPAIWLRPGENRLELYADWGRGGNFVKISRSETVSLTLTAEMDGRYSLEYYIPEGRYIFEATPTR